jgi:hypothetical protein
MKKIIFISSLFFVLGCVSGLSKQQLSLLKPGMPKERVDEILQDNGKWLGLVSTSEGIRNAWGYPTESFGSGVKFNQQGLKKYYLFFDNDRFAKYSDTFPSYMPYMQRILPTSDTLQRFFQLEI